MPIEQKALTEEEEKQLDQFGNGQIGKDDLTDNLKAFLFEEKVEKVEEEGKIEDSEDAKEEKPEGEEKPVDGESEDESASTLEKTGEKKKKRSKKEIADSENKWRQKYDSLMSKFEKSKADPSELKKFLGELGIDHGGYEEPDYISDENINQNFKSMSEEIAKLKAQIAINNQVDSERGTVAKTKSLYAEIEDLQDEFPELKTSSSISDINEFVLENGGNNVPVKTFLDNGFTKEDFENFKQITGIVSKRTEMKLSSLKHAMYEDGSYDRILSARAEQKAKTNQDQVIENARKELNAKKTAEMEKYPRNNGSTTESSTHDYNGVADKSISLKIIEKSEKYGAEKLTKDELDTLDSWLKAQPIE